MKIVLVGVYYPVAILRYFEAALRRREDVELYTVGPYTGRQIPWSSGMFVDEPPAPCKAPDMTLPMSMVPKMTEVEQMLPWEPDVWITVDAAYHLQGKPRHGTSLHIGTDPHCVNYDYNRSVARVFFNMQTPYMKDGDVWLPYAYDPVWHAPLDVEKEYDFGIVGADGRQGSLYDNRDNLVKMLRAKGYTVLQLFGTVYEAYRDALTQCKVGLNWSTQKDTTARVFETMGMGVALLTNRTPDLDKIGFIEGSHYEGFSTLDEAESRALWLMHNDNWIEMAEQGHDAVRKHTWDARIDEVLKYARA